MTEFIGEDDGAAEGGVGPQLRAERMRRGLTLEQVAAETRIPRRHLDAIEAGSFGTLPGQTYATGFARTYAKLLGYDPDEVAALVRAEMAAWRPEPRNRQPGFQPGDPARVPSASLGWLSAAAVVLLLLGGFFFMRTLFAPAAELPSLVVQQEAEEAAQRAAQQQRVAALDEEGAAPAGPVVFTAMEDVVWVRFYDASNQQLMQKEMTRGESYTVPSAAQGPQLWTGRPDALQVTIGDGPPRRLAQEQAIVRDIPVTAEALRERFAQEQAVPGADSPTN